MLAPRSIRLWTAMTLVVAIPLAAPVQAHAASGIVVEAREGPACVNGDLCLELLAIPTDLEAGHETALELRVHENASKSYAAALTTLDQADPDRQETPTTSARARTATAAPGETARVNLTTPEASHVYLWLPGEDHEARGGWETLPIGMQEADASEAGRQATHSAGAATTLTVALMLGALGLRRHDDR